MIMLIVHQMTKVASETWLRVAQQAQPGVDRKVLHCHFMEPHNRQRIETALNEASVRKTIANMLMPRATLRRGAAAWAMLTTARQNDELVRVISGIRDPVARSISATIWMADFFGHVDLPLSPRAALAPDYVIEYLREMWRLVLEGGEPDGTFEWLLWYFTGAYRTWFAEELGAVFGIDVLQSPYIPAQASQRIAAPATDIFIYRVEDMHPSAPAYPALLAQASDFLRAPVQAFPSVNTSATRRSHEITAAVRRGFSLPAAVLEKIYGTPVIRHFYSDEEITGFMARWRETR
ncbi:MAG: hypothetical protein NVSMB10_08790 [Steroidobacteraceae bacterium]